MTHARSAAITICGLCFATAASAQTLEQYGEIAILEGDGAFILDDGGGGLGITQRPGRDDPQAIARAFYSAYPDAFDEILVLTTFPDEGTPGYVAYAIVAQQDVLGIGTIPGRSAPLFDESAAWGSAGHKLHAFVDAKRLADYPQYDGLPVDDPRSLLYAVLGQEFAHRWLALARYKDAEGRISDRLLGRGGIHWSPTLQAEGSLLDGNRWVERADGSFDCVERMKRYSPLDLYLMGLRAPADVPPMFVIGNATTDGGHVIDPAVDWYECEHVRGVREDVTIQQIVDAMGPRVPAFADAPHAFRMAWVLVTRPGERAADVVETAALAERARRLWERRFVEFTGGAATVCTQLSAPCGSATARIVGGTIAGAGGNGDGQGMIEPGDPIVVEFRVENDGPVAADAVSVTVESDRATFASATVTIDRIAPGATAIARAPGVFTTDGSACNRPLLVHATARVGDGTFRGFASAVAGSATVYRADFDAGADGWARDLDGSDDAASGFFERGAPLSYGSAGYLFQPDGGAGGSPGAWFTGPERGDLSSGVTYGLAKGTSTLWSPPIDVAAAGGSGARPRLAYAAWFEAIDRSVPDRVVVAGADRMVLEARSVDGGAWFKLDQVDGADPRWRPRVVDLAAARSGAEALDLSRPIVLRFRVNRDGDADLVEAGVDAVAITADAPACHGSAQGPDGGAATALDRPFAVPGCALGAHARSPSEIAPASTLLMVAATLLGRRRRRARRTRIP
jgi:hypothetical protein